MSGETDRFFLWCRMLAVKCQNDCEKVCGKQTSCVFFCKWQWLVDRMIGWEWVYGKQAFLSFIGVNDQLIFWRVKTVFAGEMSISFFHWWGGNVHFFLSLCQWPAYILKSREVFAGFFFFGGGGASDLLPKWFVLSFCVNTWLYIWKLKTVFVLTVLWTGTPTTHTHNHPLHLSVSISLCFMKWI